MSPRNTTRPLSFWCFVSNSAFFKWQMSICEAKWNLMPFFSCFINHVRFVSDSCFVPRQTLFQISFILYQLLLLLRASSLLESITKFGSSNCNGVMNCPFSLQIWSSWWFNRDSSIRNLVNSLASKMHANFDLKSLVLLRFSSFWFFLHVLQSIAGAIGVSNFFLAFPMFSLSSLSSKSMKWILRNFLAFLSRSFSCDHFCLSFSLAFFPILLQNSGHKWSGLDVACRFVSLSPDHIHPSGNFSLNRVNWVKPIHRYPNSHRCGFLEKRRNSCE